MVYPQIDGPLSGAFCFTLNAKCSCPGLVWRDRTPFWVPQATFSAGAL